MDKTEFRVLIKHYFLRGKTLSAPKRPKTQQSAGEVMGSVFWDAH